MHPDKETWKYQNLFTAVITQAVTDAKGNVPSERTSAIAWLFRESEGLDYVFELAGFDISNDVLSYWRPVMAKEILRAHQGEDSIEQYPEDLKINDQLLKLLLYFSKKPGGESYPAYSHAMAEINQNA